MKVLFSALFATLMALPSFAADQDFSGGFQTTSRRCRKADYGVAEEYARIYASGRGYTTDQCRVKDRESEVRFNGVSFNRHCQVVIACSNDALE